MIDFNAKCSYIVLQKLIRRQKRKIDAMAVGEVVRARIDAKLKKDATAVLHGMGLSVSDAIRLMLVKVADEKGLPFELRTPNAKTKQAIKAARSGEVEKFSTVQALFDNLNSPE